jgi:Na+-translocating ferredoxin:NAD+ oxidoreductase RnfC subunit
MENYPVINRKKVRQNKELKRVQKINKRVYGKVKCKLPKAFIPKLVLLKEGENYTDLTKKDSKEARKVNIKSADELIALLANIGLKGQSGNGFPTADKLKAFNESNAENKSILINGVECDPGLIHDEWLLTHKMDCIKRGIEVLQETFKIRDVVLAVKKTEADLQGNYIVKYVPDRYPMGAEKLLIQQVLGKNIEGDELPAKKGVLVLNVQTVLTIGQIADGTYEPDSQYITVANIENGNAVAAKVLREMKITEVAKKVFECDEIKGLMSGSGIMMAHPAGKEDRVDEKTFYVAIGESVSYDDAAKCKRCGNCTRNCPSGLQVMKMKKSSRRIPMPIFRNITLKNA